MVFTPAANYEYKSGQLFLGHSGHKDIGIETNRHAITIAGSRAGKGACVVIPNLLRWQHNAVVIDPKGDNVEATWEAREALGSKVYMLDPFEVADVPKRLRAAFNPLDNIDPDSLTASADLEVIADGLVKRSDPRHAQWDDGAMTLLAGIMAFVVAEAPPEKRTLKSVRDILLQERDALFADAQEMMLCEACDGIAQEAGSIIITAIESEKSMEADFISAAKRHVKWINLKAMRNVLEESTFDLAELKNGKASVYMVLPPEYLETHAAFLRLFVRSAINAMAKGGSGKGEKCLFFLDEFYSLGKIELVAKSAGLMPSFGVHLWPILQDLGQLIQLYGQEGAQTFFGNADLHQFFGNTDVMTLEHISARMGNKGLREVPLPPAPPVASQNITGTIISGMTAASSKGSVRAGGALVGGLMSGLGSAVSANEQSEYQHELSLYQHQMAEYGKPQYTPSEVAGLVQRKDDIVADCLLNFAYGSEIILVNSAPYFRETARKKEQEQAAAQVAWQKEQDELTFIGDKEVAIIYAVLMSCGAIIACAISWLSFPSPEYLKFALMGAAFVGCVFLVDEMIDFIPFNKQDDKTVILPNTDVFLVGFIMTLLVAFWFALLVSPSAKMFNIILSSVVLTSPIWFIGGLYLMFRTPPK